jgi:hypothetical protein
LAVEEVEVDGLWSLWLGERVEGRASERTAWKDSERGFHWATGRLGHWPRRRISRAGAKSIT